MHDLERGWGVNNSSKRGQRQRDQGYEEKDILLYLFRGEITADRPQWSKEKKALTKQFILFTEL